MSHRGITTEVAADRPAFSSSVTLHTITAASTIDRTIDRFPPTGSRSCRVVLSESLRRAGGDKGGVHEGRGGQAG